MKRLAFVLAFSIAALTIGASAISARIVKNTIDPTARIADEGRRVTVSGPLSCTESQPALLRVTVTQRSTGAVAQGVARVVCTAVEQQWELDATVRGDETFAEGAATVVAVALSKDGGVTDDAHQWLVDVTLTEE